MHNCIVMLLPGTSWLSLLPFVLHAVWAIALTLNPVQFKPPSTAVNGQHRHMEKQLFFADVNTKVHAKVGSRAELPCLVYGIDLTNVVISWWKAGEYQELSLGLETRQHRYYLPRKFFEDWTLVIENIQESDAGFYACQINTDSLLEKIFLLNVTSQTKQEQARSTDQEFLKDEGFAQSPLLQGEQSIFPDQQTTTSSASFQTQISFTMKSFIPLSILFLIIHLSA
uniref:Ig-like domain-containing protein n=1 Tax=Mesocestoides corti TaxID=53468 RepID=A0A5K3ETC4_MESCO